MARFARDLVANGVHMKTSTVALATALAVAFGGVPVAASPAEGASAPAEAAATAAPATSPAVALPEFRHPRERLLTGGQPDASAWPRLASQGVSLVINLRPRAEMEGRDEAAEVARAGLAYREIPVANAADLSEDKARELWSLLQGAKGPVLVHCASGNRVGALLALAAAQAGGVAPEAALELGKRAGLAGAEPRVRELLELPARAD